MHKNLGAVVRGAEENVASPKNTAAPLTELVDLNKVVQTILIENKSLVESLGVIIRYDVLPLVMCNYEAIYRMLNFGFQSILNHPPPANKLFIYIRCEKELTEVLDMNIPAGFNINRLSIYTNIHVDEKWLHLYESSIVACKTAIQQCAGSFDWQHITNTGCLYTIVLPGKPI